MDFDKLIAIDAEIGRCLNRLYALLSVSENNDADEVLSMVAEAKAIWEDDEASFDNQRL